MCHVTPRAALGTGLVLALVAGGIYALGVTRSGSDDFLVLAWIASWWALYSWVVSPLLAERLTPRVASVQARLRERPVLLLFASLVPCGVCYALQLGDAVANGDSAQYNTQVEAGDLVQRAIHTGYYVLIWVVHRVSPFGVDAAANLTCAATALLGVGILFQLIYRESGEPWLAWVCSTALGLSPAFTYRAIYAEVHIPLTVTCLGAIALWRWNRPFLAGIVYGYGLTISVLGVVVAPLYLLPPRRGLHLAIAVIGSCVPYVILVLFASGSLFFGDRGLVDVPNHYYIGRDFVAGWSTSVKRLVSSFPFLLPLSALATVSLLRRGRWRCSWTVPVVLALTLHVGTVGIASELGSDIVLLPLLFLPLIAGWRHFGSAAGNDARTSATWFVALSLAVVFNAACALGWWIPGDQFRRPIRLQEAYRQVARQLGADTVPLGVFNQVGMYHRANDQPFDRLVDDLDESRTTHYVVLSPGELARLTSRYGPLGERTLSVGSLRVWDFRYPPEAPSSGNPPSGSQTPPDG